MIEDFLKWNFKNWCLFSHKFWTSNFMLENSRKYVIPIDWFDDVRLFLGSILNKWFYSWFTSLMVRDEMVIRWQIVLEAISQLISLIWTILKRFQLYTNFELAGIQAFLATLFLPLARLWFLALLPRKVVETFSTGVFEWWPNYAYFLNGKTDF